mmetsp:Transcript_28957/g.81545  ORF Transcript_28957/g.81545 Transcript_28957/m.81545 type:complete len:235 (-) Transcript_28957:383-1087(-)
MKAANSWPSFPPRMSALFSNTSKGRPADTLASCPGSPPVTLARSAAILPKNSWTSAGLCPASRGASLLARRSVDESNTTTATSAFREAAMAREIPSDSTGSLASRMPALSDRSTLKPPSSSGTSTTSRVVPGNGETMAASLPAIRFSTLLFPAFTGPSRTARSPSLISSPLLPSASRFWSSCLKFITRGTTARATSSLSSASSPKSRTASTLARQLRSSFLHLEYTEVWLPPIA